MILTDYYRFVKLDDLTSSRIDCVVSTKSYDLFENNRATKEIKATSRHPKTNIGALIAYYLPTFDIVKADAQRKADKSFSMKNAHISSIYKPDLSLSFGFGDVKGTSDALLFIDQLKVADGKVLSGTLDVFIARGQAKNCMQLYQMACNGSLDEDMDNLIEKGYSELPNQ